MTLSTRAIVSLRIMALVIALATSAFAQTLLDKASALQKQGKFSEARDLYRQAAAEGRASGNQAYLAIALGEAGNISIQLGDYSEAIRDVEEAIKLRQALHQDTWMSEDFTTVGLAYYYMGNFPAALENYREESRHLETRDARGPLRRGSLPVPSETINLSCFLFRSRRANWTWWFVARAEIV